MPLELETAEGLYRLEPRDDVTPERLFDRRWAVTLLSRVLAQLRTEFSSAGKEVIFESLKGALTGEGLDASYIEVGAALGMSEGAVKVAVHRLRRRYRELLEGRHSRRRGGRDSIPHHGDRRVTIRPMYHGWRVILLSS